MNRYLCTLTIAPAFLSASIYLCLSRLIIIYTPKAARFKPQVYTYLFIGFDIFSLVLQATGGGIASTADTKSTQWAGVHLMVAGVAFQVFSLGVYAILCLDFFLGVRRVKRTMGTGSDVFNPQFAALRARPAQHRFLWSLMIAGIFIFVRSVFRCAELSEGFDGQLANDEVTFMILEGIMIILAVICMTVYHPGRVWGNEGWSAASWGKKDAIKVEQKIVHGNHHNGPTATGQKKFWQRLGSRGGSRPESGSSSTIEMAGVKGGDRV